MSTHSDDDHDDGTAFRRQKPCCSRLKAICSLALLLFSIILVMILILQKQTKLSHDVHPALAFFVLVIALLWLALVEGGQAAMVGLPPIDRRLYKKSHPIAWRICERGHEGDNLDRYLLGRQFIVLVLVFCINLAGAPMVNDVSVGIGLPDIMADIFLKSGLALILMTAMIGQLSTQINASHCMLDFINDWGNWFTVQVTLIIEASGLLHASYLIPIVIAKLANRPLVSNEPERSLLGKILFGGRVLVSCVILLGAMVVTVTAIFQDKTTMWNSVPSVVSLLLFLVLMSILGMLEGMQIAFFAVSKLTHDERSQTAWAKRTCELLFEGEGQNLPGFMVGRQLLVASCFFVLARIISMDIEEGEDNVFGVGTAAQEFFDTGLLGALVTAIVASIAWQLVAAAFPLAFLSNPFTYILLRICLWLEATGICAGAWVLAAVHRELAGFETDEDYVGTAEERAAMNRGDRQGAVSGLLAGGAFPANHDLPLADKEVFHHHGPHGSTKNCFHRRRAKLLADIRDVCAQLNLAESDAEKKLYTKALKKLEHALKHLNREELRHAQQASLPAVTESMTHDDSFLEPIEPVFLEDGLMNTTGETSIATASVTETSPSSSSVDNTTSNTNKKQQDFWNLG